MDTHGYGLSSVRFICGTQDIHKELEGEPEIFPGVKAVLTPGHAPYHWSFLLTLKDDGNILICSDAIYCQDNIDHDSWGGQMEPEVAKVSAQKLLALAKETSATGRRYISGPNSTMPSDANQTADPALISVANGPPFVA